MLPKLPPWGMRALWRHGLVKRALPATFARPDGFVVASPISTALCPKCGRDTTSSLHIGNPHAKLCDIFPIKEGPDGSLQFTGAPSYRALWGP